MDQVGASLLVVAQDFGANFAIADSCAHRTGIAVVLPQAVALLCRVTNGATALFLAELRGSRTSAHAFFVLRRAECHEHLHPVIVRIL